MDQVGKGNTATIFRQDDKVIKVFHERFGEGEAFNEARKQRFAFESGLPVPEVKEVTKIDGRQAIVMEYIEGTTLGDNLEKDMNYAEYYLRQSIAVQMEIHKIDAIDLNPMPSKLARQISAAPKLNRNQKEALLEKLASMDMEKKLCHGDFHIYNLMEGGGRVTILDWVDASGGNPRADVYRTYLLYSQHYPSLADDYVKIYCEESGVPLEEIFDWAPIIAGARLAEQVDTEDPDRLLEIVDCYVTGNQC
ncbi:phosphotransferase family protein [Thalassobacillus hwangdonensis]